MDVLDDILGAPATELLTTASAAVDVELVAYLSDDVIPCTESPTAWWAATAAQFPLLAVEAKCFLSSPPTSVASKRLFSSAAQIYTVRHSRLLPKRADTLFFMKHNLPVVKFNYGSISK